MMGNLGGEETDLDKIAEDELARLQRQYRIMEMERVTMCGAVKPKLRKQRQLLQCLTKEYDQIMLDLKVSTSASNVKKDLFIGNEMSELLSEQERCANEISAERFQLGEMTYLSKQLEKEVIQLRSQQTTEKEAMEGVTQSQQRVGQLENRLDVATKRFNTVNAKNFKMRQEIDHLLRERAHFNIVWAKAVNSVTSGKNLMMELVEQSTMLYDQREEWCHKLQAIKERAQYDQIEHNHEMGELQRQLDHDSKLQQFLAVKGSVRVMAELEAKEIAKKRAQKDKDIATQERYKEILHQIQDFAGETDLERLIAKFTKQDEENYALFNYVNVVNQELEALANSVGELKINIDEMRIQNEEREKTEQESSAGLVEEFNTQKKIADDLKLASETAQQRLDTFMTGIQNLFIMMQCNAAPILKLLGTNAQVNIYNVMLYLKTIERKILDVVNCSYYAEKMKKLEDARNKGKLVTTVNPTPKTKTPKEHKKSRSKTNVVEKSMKV